MKILKDNPSEKSKNLKLQNDQAIQKIEQYNYQLGLLEIRRAHFEKISRINFLPMFLRAKYMLKSLDIKSEIIAKQHFIQIYSERIQNVRYAEHVLEPEKKH
ncbi:MAG TPA: hypothetical protein PLB59_09710 [Bacteroidales bacterium]|nr:hypothetical protein [Bacteroidales bacterium]HQP16233.1 hypothetical protein [Bacteroidales bacterium]